MTAIDPLFVDVYQGDLGGRPDWDVLAKLGAPWHGAIVKATEGVTYAPDWFAHQWRALRNVAGERYGADWFRGAYHFLKFDVDGAKQAEWYALAVDRAGGWGVGDLWPIVDVELGSERNANQRATGPQIVACVRAFAARIRELLGRDVVLYGNGAMRDRRITERMDCDWLWCPRYTAHLPAFVYERAGWSPDRLVWWQYGGDGSAQLAGYPAFPPGFGKCDVSALVHGGGLEWLRSRLWAERPA